MAKSKPAVQATRFPFTQAKVAALSVPAAGRTYYYDTRCPGLAVAVFPSGAKTFYRYGRVKGRPVRLKLGGFPAISVERAQKLCTQASGLVAEGKDPHQQRQSARGGPTLNDLFTWWFERHARPTKRTADADLYQFNRYLKKWANRRLSTITKADVVSWHRRCGEKHGPYSANRVLAMLRTMFNKADEIGYDGPNPCHRVKAFPERSRDRFLQPDELPTFVAALAKVRDENIRDAIAMLLWTGQRRGSVLSMTWADVDLGQSLWRIPPEASKNGKAVLVHLADPARAILQARFDNRGASPWVFPSHSKSGHLENVKDAWRRLIQRSGLNDLRPHDLRRTVGSWLAIGGANMATIGAALGHQSQQATAVYARLNHQAVTAAVDDVAGRLLAAANGKSKGQGGGGA